MSATRKRTSSTDPVADVKKKSRVETSTKRKTLRESTYKTAVRDLRENGYFWIRGAIPEELCEPCASAIQKDIKAKLDAGSVHQEEPIERLRMSTVTKMIKVRDYILEDVLNHEVSLCMRLA